MSEFSSQAGLPKQNPRKFTVEYYELLRQIHLALVPQTYLEIGVGQGASLALAGESTLAIGIDPDYRIVFPPRARTKLFRMTSDAFFRDRNPWDELEGLVVDLAFIDGMHLFEFVLRDFINVEQYSGPFSTILVHDCIPLNRITARRRRSTVQWTGDVWKLLVCLKRYRPDLEISTLEVGPTGLAIIRGLDPKSGLLKARLNGLCKEFVPLTYDYLITEKQQKLNCAAPTSDSLKRIFGVALDFPPLNVFPVVN